LQFAVAHGFIDPIQPGKSTVGSLQEVARWRHTFHRVGVTGLMDDDRPGVAIGIGIKLDTGEIGWFLTEDDAEQEVGADRRRGDGVGRADWLGFNEPGFAAIGDVANDAVGLRQHAQREGNQAG
jgi:hypothetical protein